MSTPPLDRSARAAVQGDLLIRGAHLLDPSLDPPIALRQGYPDDTSAPKEVRYLTEIVFQKYYDARAPKYVFEQSPQ